MTLSSRTPGKEQLFRIARAPDPWQPPDWARAGPDGTFGNRFDDPAGVYRVLYASSERLGCFLETLARFRLDFTLLVELQEIAGEDDFVPLGVLPVEWFAGRLMGIATVEGNYAQLYSADWVGHLRPRLAQLAASLGFRDVDVAALQSDVRPLTMRASRLVSELGFHGIYYRSRYGHDIQNWALFEPFFVMASLNEAISRTDEDLQTALLIHRIRCE